MFYKDRWWNSLEHAYQAAKTLVKGEQDIIWASKSAKEAKRIGKALTMRNDWESIKENVMLDLLRIKFQYGTLKEQLLSTGDAELIEGNWWGDTYWGVCKGVGENKLGKLLMKVRSELKPTFKILTDIVEFRGRAILAVRLPGGKTQPFYKRTGKGTLILEKETGAQAGDWVPFDGLTSWGWFKKEAYCNHETVSPELRRFGTPEYKAVSDWLKTQTLIPTKTMSTPEEVNYFLQNYLDSDS